MPTPDEEAKWLPVAQQILDRWGVKHESLKGTIAMEIAGVVAEERERCAKIADTRAKVWEEAEKGEMHGPCSMSLWEECEDIAQAIRGNNPLRGRQGDRP